MRTTKTLIRLAALAAITALGLPAQETGYIKAHGKPGDAGVFINGKEVDPPLSLPQYRLLELLVDSKGGVCTRDQVIEAVWPEVVGEGVSEQAIDALVRRAPSLQKTREGRTPPSQY